jgi:hypothetical protein
VHFSWAAILVVNLVCTTFPERAIAWSYWLPCPRTSYSTWSSLCCPHRPGSDPRQKRLIYYQALQHALCTDPWPNQAWMPTMASHGSGLGQHRPSSTHGRRKSCRPRSSPPCYGRHILWIPWASCPHWFGAALPWRWCRCQQRLRRGQDIVTSCYNACNCNIFYYN